MASASPDLGELRWSSKPGRSRERKRISTRNIIPLVNTFRSVNKNRLATLNDENIKEGPKFELVKPLGCMVVDLMGVFHCNFIARPIGGSEADEKLFFAKVELDLWEEEQADKYGGEEVTLTGSKGRFISILGPPDSKKDLYGCRSCTKIGHIQHPKGVCFRKY